MKHLAVFLMVLMIIVFTASSTIPFSVAKAETSGFWKLIDTVIM